VFPRLENVAFEFDEYKQKHPDTSDDLAEEENLRIEVEALAKKATSAQEVLFVRVSQCATKSNAGGFTVFCYNNSSRHL